MQSKGVESHRLAKDWQSTDRYSNGTGWQCYAKEPQRNGEVLQRYAKEPQWNGKALMAQK
jgi:hypothetical protein